MMLFIPTFAGGGDMGGGGGTAKGRFAYSPMSSVPNAAVRIVATVLGPCGIPANARIAGLTTMM